MDFGLSDAQTMLQRSIGDFMARKVPMERVRSIMESEGGLDRRLHRELGEQGIAGLLVPEEQGGAGLGLLDAVVAAQELGRSAAPLSFHSAYVMAPLLLRLCENEEQKQTWLPRIAEGSVVVGVAPGRLHDDAEQLSGSLLFVPDAASADAFLLTMGDGDVMLFARDTQGLSVEPMATIDDTRRIGELRFAATPVTEGHRLGVPAGVVDIVLAAGRIALAADALAAAQKGLHLAVDYAKQREQFGRVIGSFQAVKHMCAETVAAIDPVQSLLWYTAYAWDRELEETAHLAPLLKSHATETATEAASTCTQVFGGMGFTWECDMHIYSKRVAYDRQMLGGPVEMRELAAAAL